MVSAQDAQEISRLIRLGQFDIASTKADALLARNPKDPQARFLKGVVLSEQGKTGDAIAAFQSLTEDYPELPEPYNNLASLFAAKGQFEKAKTALEMAIQINPSYATAYENLGDVYAKMASQAYDRVLQLDKTNATAQAKLKSIRSAFPASGKPAAATPATPAAAAPEGKSRAEWEAARRASFPTAQAVQVNIDQPQVIVRDGNLAEVTLHQRYRSEQANLTTRKSLLLAREDGGWHIAQERILP